MSRGRRRKAPPAPVVVDDVLGEVEVVPQDHYDARVLLGAPPSIADSPELVLSGRAPGTSTRATCARRRPAASPAVGRSRTSGARSPSRRSAPPSGSREAPVPPIPPFPCLPRIPERDS